MRSRWMTTTTMMAIVVAGLAPAPLTVASAKSSIGDQGFCRNAAALPQLQAETAARPQQMGSAASVSAVSAEARDRSDDGEGAYPTVPAPPPPSPPPPPPPMMEPSPTYDVPMDSVMAPSPPIPGSASDMAAESDSDSVVVTGSRIGGSSKAAAGEARAVSGYSSPSMPPRPYPRPQPQSGLLTAGEHDDLLNPELYAAYVKRSNLGQEVQSLPRVDTTRVVTVTVKDGSGQPVPFADVTVACSDGNRITMATQADGSAVFFPGLDRLSERISVSAHMDGRPIADARPVLVVGAPGGQTVGLTASTRAAKVTKLDLMLVIDTTGSMGDEISFLQSEMRSILSSITAKHRDLDIRVGFVFYRDLGDDYVTRTMTFDRDIGKMQGVLARQEANGGGDYPEAMDQAMVRAVGQAWRPDAVKSLLLVADAPPHDDLFGRTWQATEAARAKRIHITPVAASGVADKAEYAMRAMAASTQSRYLFLTDDSGIGNPHAPPAIDCYLVTRLDALVRRVVDSQISGRRVEPDDREVIRSVGKYDAGKCVLPADFQWQ